MVKWRVSNSRRHRETPCCRQPVRVKIIEPGVQERKCPLCHTVNYFTLEPSTDPRWKGVLFMRWIGEDEAHDIRAAVEHGDDLTMELDLSNFTL